jgi:hypothetical protein
LNHARILYEVGLTPPDSVSTFVRLRPEAQVAELVDALVSGASGRDTVEVQVLSWAPGLHGFVPFRDSKRAHSTAAAPGLAPSDLESLRHAKKSRLRALVDWLDGRSLELLGVAARTLSKLATGLLNEL